MPLSSLPEELLREILLYCFYIPPEQFFDFPVPRWATYLTPKVKPLKLSQLLLVSKQWLRVGTPLLYSSLRLTQTTHTKAVAALVKANPNLGKAIRSLKLEGGYGNDLFTIVKLAPNITNLYVNLEILSSESIVGLRKSLPLMRPTNVWLRHFEYGRVNKKVAELRTLLMPLVKEKWNTMVSAFTLSLQTRLTRISSSRNLCICPSGLRWQT